MDTQNNLSPEKSRQLLLVVVDDEEQILMSIRSLLRREGFNMHFFSSGAEALEFLNKNNANIILTDMRMPGISGVELLEKSMLLCPEAIRIIISGYEEKSIILDALSKGYARQYIMKPWDDTLLKRIIIDSMELQNKARKNKLMQILSSFNKVPSPPVLYNKLIDMLNNDQQSQKDIANEIEKSTALVAKLLRISNSIFYGTRNPITTVYDAITFIGTEAVLNIVLSLESFHNFIKEAPPNLIHIIEDIQIKSIKRAQISREIAAQWYVKLKHNEAYVAGLMLDIGLVARICSNDKRVQDFISYPNKSKPIFSIDKEIFNVTHDEVGEALLTYWNFSQNTIAAVANHHCYSNGDNLTMIVQIADAIIQGKDSFPHDSIIESEVEKWKVCLHNTMELLNISEFN